jgi:hypothetical protein
MMNERSENLLSLRPVLSNAKIITGMSDEERFQNQTLRPILKLQNDLLLASFQNYIVKTKNRFHELKLEKRIEYISNALQKDIKYRNTIKGLIVGQFTIEEYHVYSSNASAFNKRITNMVIKRLQDQMQFFEHASLI